MNPIKTQPRALVIDESNLSRSVLSTLLRDQGYAVTLVARPEEAVRSLKAAASPYDLILCEYHFTPRGSHTATGQDWLDEMRRSRSLPLTTAVLMVTGESRYQCVADSVENALDDYLLKPFAAKQLQERLSITLRRKHALRDVYAAIEVDDFSHAAVLCEKVFKDGGPHRLAAARLGSELYLRLSKHDEAQRLLQAVLDCKALPWARLGLALVEVETQNTKKACRALEALICDEPAYSDAYDLFGRALVEELQFDRALENYAKAVELTPGNIVRLQKLGNLELFLGQSAQAFKHLDAAINLGSASPALDYQSLFQICVAGYDLKKLRVWERPSRLFINALRKAPGSYRLTTLQSMTRVLENLERRSTAKALDGLKALVTQIQDPQFDFEMACNLLQMLSRTEQAEVRLANVTEIVVELGLRYSVSRPALELLVMAGREHPGFEGMLRQSFEQVNDMARKAMWHSMQGRSNDSVKQLIQGAKSTRNARFMALAKASIQKHREKLGEEICALHLAEVAEMQDQYCSYGTHANASIRARPLRPVATT